MESKNETVAEIVKEIRDKFPPKYCSSKHCRVEVHQPILDFAYRVEVAHGREVAAKDGERNGILKANASLAADNTRLRGEVAELRECLNEAVFVMQTLFDKQMPKWRKALKGEENERVQH